MNDYNDLVNSLIEGGWLKSFRIIKAFRKIKREDFLPSEIKEMAGLNEALTIGYGQTISQPLVVAFMIELLNPEKGDKILDIGSGSGWTTALIAELIKPTGKVIALETIPELFSFGRDNVTRYNFLTTGVVSFFNRDASGDLSQLVNFPDFSDGFDKILSSAALKRKEGKDILESLPLFWRNNLKIGGILVTPIDSSIWTFSKEEKNKFAKKEYPGFSFVPLVSH